MRPKNFVLFCLFLLTGWQAFGQKFKYAHYTGEEVPFKKVNQTIQDFKGYVWLGTDQGLFRFDGNSFEDFNTSLRSKTIRAFIPWEENSLLFSNDTGIHKIRYSGEEPRVEVFKNPKYLHYPNELFRDSQNRLWTGQMNGSIMMFSDTNFQGKHYELTPGIKTPRIFFGEDKFGTVWALVPQQGIFYLNFLGQEFRPLKNYKAVNHFLVEDDVIWLVGDRLEKFSVTGTQDIQGRQIFASDKQFKYISKNNVGTLFLATESSIHTFRTTGNQARLTKVFGANDPHRVEELAFETISWLGFTSDETRFDNVIWVSTHNGLWLMWSGFFQSVSGLRNDNVRGVNSTKGGPILISQGVVSKININEASITSKREHDLNEITGIASHGNDAWYGSSDGKVFHYQNRRLVRTYDLNDRGSGIFFVLADHTGEVWLCQSTSEKPIIGIAKIDLNGNLVEYGSEKGFTNRVLVIREGGKNELYAAGIGISSYLYKYDRQSDRFQNKSLPFPFKVSRNFEVHDMAVDQKGIAWLATTDGLLKYDTETIRRVDLGEFTKNEIRSISTMPNGTLWLATDTNGLLHLDTTGSYVRFDEKSGTPSKIASYRCMALYNESQLWVGTAEGAVFSARAVPDPLETMTPSIKGIVIEGKEVDVKKSIKIGESADLNLDMTTLTFPSDDVGYQFRLFDSELPNDEIYDIPWTNTETSSITFNEMVGGNYTAQIRGQKAGGFKWSKPLELGIKVYQKWYRTWWGIFILVLLALTNLWYFARRWFLSRVGRLQASLKQQQKELRKKEAELVTQGSALERQKSELQSTGTNIFLLHRLIRQIPKDADWVIMMPILSKLVELPTGIDKFELAFKKNGDVKYKGYERENGKITERFEEFDEKKNLASYVIATDKMLSVNDFDREVNLYVSGKENDGYLSRSYIPFEPRRGPTIVFCAYAKQKNAFSERTNTLLGILVRFLSINVKNQLK